MHVDYHVHSICSFDGKDTVREICREAIERGLDEICFTEHFSVDPKDVSFAALNYSAYARSVDACREEYKGRLAIRRGLEIGEPHVEAYRRGLQEALRNMDLDFVIGSVHNLHSVKLRLAMRGKTKRDAYQDYFDEALRMVSSADIDVVGHLDLMKRYACETYGNYAFEEFRCTIQAILERMIARDIGLEINTSGLRDRAREVYPAPETLRLYKRLGGRLVTVGSDAHRRADVGEGIHAATKMLRDAGFKSMFVYARRVPREVPL